MNKVIDFAYTAGYIDGDGCFYIGEIKTSPFYQDTFSIVSTSLTNIEWFQCKFKGTINPKKSRQKNRLPSYHFVFSKEGYKDLIYIYPYLVEKRTECKFFQEFRNPIGDFKNSIRKSLIMEMRYIKNHSNLIDQSIKKELESIRNTITPTQEDFAYLAGFIDSECSIGIQRQIRKNTSYMNYRNHLQCNNTKSPIFYWVSQRFGGQFHFLDKSHIQNCRNQMLWRLSCKQLYPILENIYPFLKHKKPICEEMIKFQNTKCKLSRESMYHKVSHLNKISI